MTTNSYDTKDGIERYLNDGLSGFHRLLEHRRAAYRSNEQPLTSFTSFLLLGRWHLDACGNLGRTTFSAYVNDTVYDASWYSDALRRVVVFDDLFKPFSYGLRADTVGARLPPENHTCTCGEGWTLENLHDIVERQSGSTFFYSHTLCYKLTLERGTMLWYEQVMKDAGWAGTVLSTLPNGYDNSDIGAEPWVLVRAPFGSFTLGRRKNVWSLDWSDHYDALMKGLEYEGREKIRESIDGNKLFGDEGMTKDTCLVHAGSRGKLVEYLGKLKAAMLTARKVRQVMLLAQETRQHARAKELDGRR